MEYKLENNFANYNSVFFLLSSIYDGASSFCDNDDE